MLSSIHVNIWKSIEQREGKSRVENFCNIHTVGRIQIARRTPGGMQLSFSKSVLFYMWWVRLEAPPGNTLSSYLHFAYNFGVASGTGKLIVFCGASCPVPHRQSAITCPPASVQLGFSCHARCARRRDWRVCEAGWLRQGGKLVERKSGRCEGEADWERASGTYHVPVCSQQQNKKVVHAGLSSVSPFSRFSIKYIFFKSACVILRELPTYS